ASLAHWLPEPDAPLSAVPSAVPVPAVELPAEPPINLAALAEILGDDDPAGLAEIIAFFIDSYPDQAADMRAALANGSRLGLRDAAHAGKSEARNAGANALAEILTLIEAKAMTETSFAELAALFEQAERAFAAIRKFSIGLGEGA
ncbi:MAG: Hpt domain-containing protein, partial [Magnetospirillum sp.]|nr:Hpt domain-containing protein [Magnetospirillum sp.]